MLRRCSLLVAAALMLGAGPDSPPDSWTPAPTQPTDISKTWKAALVAIDLEQFRLADALLTRVVTSQPENADALNLLGYANRKLGRTAVALEHYTRALGIDPQHRGALEYMAEAYLVLQRPADANALLVRLRAACPDGCRELSQLETAIASATSGSTP